MSWPNINNHWQDLRNVLTEEAVTDLAYCAEAIHKFYNEEGVAQDELDEIKKEVDNLFEEIRESDIEIKLRIMLLDLLEAMRRSIAEYNIRGAKGIREVVDYSVGSILRNREEIKDNENVKKILRFLIKVDNVVSRALKYAPLLGYVSKFLLPNGQDDQK